MVAASAAIAGMPLPQDGSAVIYDASVRGDLYTAAVERATAAGVDYSALRAAYTSTPYLGTNFFCALDSLIAACRPHYVMTNYAVSDVYDTYFADERGGLFPEPSLPPIATKAEQRDKLAGGTLTYKETNAWGVVTGGYGYYVAYSNRPFRLILTEYVYNPAAGHHAPWYQRAWSEENVFHPWRFFDTNALPVWRYVVRGTNAFAPQAIDIISACWSNDPTHGYWPQEEMDPGLVPVTLSATVQVAALPWTSFRNDADGYAYPPSTPAANTGDVLQLVYTNRVTLYEGANAAWPAIATPEALNARWTDLMAMVWTWTTNWTWTNSLFATCFTASGSTNGEWVEQHYVAGDPRPPATAFGWWLDPATLPWSDWHEASYTCGDATEPLAPSAAPALIGAVDEYLNYSEWAHFIAPRIYPEYWPSGCKSYGDDPDWQEAGWLTNETHLYQDWTSIASSIAVMGIATDYCHQVDFYARANYACSSWQHPQWLESSAAVSDEIIVSANRYSVFDFCAPGLPVFVGTCSTNYQEGAEEQWFCNEVVYSNWNDICDEIETDCVETNWQWDCSEVTTTYQDVVWDGPYSETWYGWLPMTVWYVVTNYTRAPTYREQVLTNEWLSYHNLCDPYWTNPPVIHEDHQVQESCGTVPYYTNATGVKMWYGPDTPTGAWVGADAFLEYECCEQHSNWWTHVNLYPTNYGVWCMTTNSEDYVRTNYTYTASQYSSNNASYRYEIKAEPVIIRWDVPGGFTKR